MYPVNGNEYGKLETGQFIRLNGFGNESIVLEITSVGIDLSSSIFIDSKKPVWKLASWQGTSGRVRLALDQNESSKSELKISSIHKAGPSGKYNIEILEGFTPEMWQAERNMMLGLDLHYRHYLKEFDRRDEAVTLMQKALKYWLDQNVPKEIARVSYELAALHRGMGNLNNAYKNYTLAKDNYFVVDDLDGAAAAANVMGLIDRKQGRL